MRASRRQLLAGLGAVTLAGGLNGCRREPGPGPVGPATPSSVASTAQNPFGVPSGSRVELWVDDQFSPSWLDGLGTAAGRSTPSLQLRATSTAELAGQLTSRFRADAVPPGLVLNTGPDELGLGQLGSQLADLAPVLAARVDQRTLRESLRPGTVQTDADGQVRGLAATWQVHGLWYSRALFRQHGWHPPTTCEELLSLGAAARTQGKYLFTWGRDVATWFQRLAISAATRQHGTGLLARLE
ncbi:hypothetical protein [Luteococcus peritonei]|uniref:Extracellular solute-binding protein n=1 Tax=Luteococcus peritonei TaxID=88874 RepID=A0ABW4RUD1_9ACTN